MSRKIKSYSKKKKDIMKDKANDYLYRAIYNLNKARRLGGRSSGIPSWENLVSCYRQNVLEDRNARIVNSEQIQWGLDVHLDELEAHPLVIIARVRRARSGFVKVSLMSNLPTHQDLQSTSWNRPDSTSGEDRSSVPFSNETNMNQYNVASNVQRSVQNSHAQNTHAYLYNV